MRARQIIAGLGSLLGTAALAAAPPEELCPGFQDYVAADGRMLGHLPYSEAFPAWLQAMPASFAVGQPCLLHRDAVPDLTRLLADARAAGITGLRGISCYRSVARQRSVFCAQVGPKRRCRNPAERARSVGPPGYSEHATGYALDFGVRPAVRGCPDTDACLARTAAGAWLLANAPRYGFELSFPDGNRQQVTWEPWHWRWVGITATTPGAAQARFLFARARRDYPALPNVPDAVATDVPPPVPAVRAPPSDRVIGPR